MKKHSILLLLVALLVAVTGYAQEKPIIVVHAFTTAPDVAWPYDMKQMQAQTVAEMKAKLIKRFDVVDTVPANKTAKV